MEQGAYRLSCAAEVVLCMLLAKFTFAPSEKKIVWNLSNVRYPSAGDDPKPAMPMKVAR